MITDNTAKWQKKKLTNFASNEALPVGHIYQSLSKNVPLGSLPLLGGEYDRTLYADLWSWANENGLVVSDAEWQAMATAQGGSCSKFSDGNGSTTFRVPALKCWVKGANGVSEVGSYLEAGLPNLYGQFGTRGTTTNVNAIGWTDGELFTTASSITGESLTGSATQKTSNTHTFNASNYNSIYGNSDTVQPPSIVAMYCIIAYGTVTNVGSVDISSFIKELEQVKNAVDNEVGFIKPYGGDNVPEGWLACNGAELNRSTYADLFAVIGTKYGAGDGSTTFNLPNLNNNSFLEGSNTVGTVKSAGLPNITGLAGGMVYVNNNQWFDPQATGAFRQSTHKTLFDLQGKTSYPAWSDANFDMDASRSSSIYGGSNTVQPKAVTVKYCIKY